MRKQLLLGLLVPIITLQFLIPIMTTINAKRGDTPIEVTESVTLVINEGSDYTNKDIVRRTISFSGIETLDLEYRLTYSDGSTGEKSVTDWKTYMNIQGNPFTEPDYLLKGNIDGEKEICIELKTKGRNLEACDSIILDTTAPTGSIIINPVKDGTGNGDEPTESNMVSVHITMENTFYESDDSYHRPSEDKVLLCHIPQGNPINKHTIEISKNALDAHLSHGDTLGECVGEILYYSISTDGVNWTTFTQITESSFDLNGITLSTTNGIAEVFLKVKDRAGNEFVTSDTIYVNGSTNNEEPTPTNPTEKIYGAEYFSRTTSSPTTFTLNTIPSELDPGIRLNLTFNVKNTSNFTWYPNGEILNPVNISYHWLNTDTNTYYQWNGNRGFIYIPINPEDIAYGVSLQVYTPEIPGNYLLIIDTVEEGITWFNQQGVNTYNIPISIGATNINDNEGLDDYTGSDDFGYGGYTAVACTLTVNSNLLVSPDPNSGTLATINNGQTVYAFNYSGNYAQIQIKVDNEIIIGWLDMNDINCESNLSESLPQIITTDTYREKAFICDSRQVAIKMYPSWDSSTINYLYLNDEIYVLEQVPDNKGETWLQIMTLNGISGWVPDSFVCVTRDGQTYNWTDYIQTERAYDDPNYSPDGSQYDVGITSDFGERLGDFHAGVDYGLYCGTELYAVADGKVLMTFTEGIDEGNNSTIDTPANYVIIEHESNPDPVTGEVYKFQSRYWHLDEVWVTPGQIVEQGQPIGTSGNTGYVRGNESTNFDGGTDYGCHLHFEILRYNSDNSLYNVDPELMFQYGEADSPVVLGLSGLGDFGYGNSNISVQFDQLKPVYRFYAPSLQAHFYTISEEERATVETQFSDTWEYEKIAFYAYDHYVDGTKMVYRFLNKNTGSTHFYTIKDEDRKTTQNLYSETWELEDQSKFFYAYPTNVNDIVNPLYRYWNGEHHFYTIEENEKNVIENNWSNVWDYDGIDFYAIQVSKYAKYDMEKNYDFTGLVVIDEGSECGTWKKVIYKDGKFYANLYYNPILDESFLVFVKNAHVAAYEEVPDRCNMIGLPTSDTNIYLDGNQSQTFDKGEIFSDNNSGSLLAFSVYGKIYDMYKEQKKNLGDLGYPRSMVKNGCQDFEAGQFCIPASTYFECLQRGGEESCIHPAFEGYVMHPLGVDPACSGFSYTSGVSSDREVDLDGDGYTDITGHNGVDLAKEDGCMINSVSSGLVTTSLCNNQEGCMITIDHGSFRSTYWHGAELPTVSSGSEINNGIEILKMGMTGFATGIHLHFGIVMENPRIFVDPESDSQLMNLSANGLLFILTKKY